MSGRSASIESDLSKVIGANDVTNRASKKVAEEIVEAM
jgi:NAD/NADP transhydrogenase beta subunit